MFLQLLLKAIFGAIALYKSKEAVGGLYRLLCDFRTKFPLKRGKFGGFSRK